MVGMLRVDALARTGPLELAGGPLCVCVSKGPCPGPLCISVVEKSAVGTSAGVDKKLIKECPVRVISCNGWMKAGYGCRTVLNVVCC